MAENDKREEILELGKFGLIAKLSEKFQIHHASTLSGIGCDAAVLKSSKNNSLLSSKIFLENVHFDLTYFPLKHLGYKTIAVAISDILGMNGTPTQVVVNIAVSNRFSIETVNELTTGMQLCCNRYKIDLIGLDLTTSQSGLTIAVSVSGEVESEDLVKRNGAKENELICVSGDFGAAYTGLILLEREKKVFEVDPNSQPDFDGYDYVLERQLKPEPRLDIIEALKKENIKPSAMINVSDGLASALINLCKASHMGCDIFENKIPIDAVTFQTLKEMKIVATTIALNGGEDYELLFTIPQSDYEKIKKVENISIIGYIKEAVAGY
ncbi:MAG: thiamine-phosphate kinase, partial [Bacteroidales bacterium]